MSELPRVMEIGPEDEAARLWKGAQEARGRAAESLVSLCEALDLGVRAAEILAIHRLQPVRERFPGTIALQLETPAAEVDPTRDAVNVPKALQFTEILDLLSEDSLSCVGPRLHRGWEDRTFSCSRSRGTAAAAVGFSLDGQPRDSLLILSAYRNRLFRYPPPLRLVPHEILEAFPALDDLVERLS